MRSICAVCGRARSLAIIARPAFSSLTPGAHPAKSALLPRKRLRLAFADRDASRESHFHTARSLSNSAACRAKGEHRDDSQLIPDEPPTGSAKLLADALAEEASLGGHASEQCRRDAEKKARLIAGQGEVWTGDERVEATIERMLQNKYKPLRMRAPQSGYNTQHPGDVKMGSIQQPDMSGPIKIAPNMTSTGSIGTHVVPPSTSSRISALLDLPPPDAEGRRLPKTPEGQPWLATFINPAHIGGKSRDESGGSIYRAKYISVIPNKSKKTAGIPWDDPRAMSRLREGRRKAERQGRMLRAKENTLDYRLGLKRGSDGRVLDVEEAHAEELEKSELRTSGAPLSESDAANWDLTDVTDRRSQEEKDSELVFTSGGGGIGGIIEERIKESMRNGNFKTNSLRGKPLSRTEEESNPYLSREERLMNRLVKRQGAAPPFVELNSDLESTHQNFRMRLQDSALVDVDSELQRCFEASIEEIAVSLIEGLRKSGKLSPELLRSLPVGLTAPSSRRSGSLGLDPLRPKKEPGTGLPDPAFATLDTSFRSFGEEARQGRSQRQGLGLALLLRRTVERARHLFGA
ncbi:Molecular chaperone (DnaJ superfamily) [Ceraceosorus bombacis]|uniref:Molecular chaperone (DnaJ superfamily) n=1 Tax=Ceraceosorus bombacis TaxID=401625 RepID=A0A0P1BJW5_9BASI|nr:Molecular chaperone (DnaJ superfamily) [Ceraceosorus bombacis]